MRTSGQSPRRSPSIAEGPASAVGRAARRSLAVLAAVASVLGLSAAISASGGQAASADEAKVDVTVTLKKEWVNAEAGHRVRLRATAPGQLVETTATAPAGAPANSGALSVRPGGRITLEEMFLVGHPTNYDLTWECVDSGGAVVSSTQFVTAPRTDGTLTCTATNTRNSTPLAGTLELRKAWVDGDAGDTAALTAVGERHSSSVAPSIATAESVAGETAEGAEDVAVLPVVSGETVALSETLSAGDYTTSLACASGTLTYTAGAVAGTVTAGTGKTVCTFTNTKTAASTTLTLEKGWESGKPGDRVALTATSGNTGKSIIDASAVAPDKAGPNSATVYAGNTINLAESFSAGDADNYDSSWRCVDSGGTELSTTDTLVVPSGGSAPLKPITCKATSTRKRVEVDLRKKWVNGDAGDTAVLTVAGAESGTDSDTSTAAAGSNDPDTANMAELTVFAGEAVALSETLSVGHYTTGLECSGPEEALTYTEGAVSGTLAADAGEASVVCTFTNTRTTAQASLTLEKAWENAKPGDRVALTATSRNTAKSIIDASAVAPDDAAPNRATVYAGNTIDLAEAFSVGDADNYDVSWRCVDRSGAQLSDTYTVVVPAAPSPITCTATNSRKAVEVTLRKRWVDAKAGDTAKLTISARESGPRVSGSEAATSTATGAADQTDDANVAELTVYAGQTAVLTEGIRVVDYEINLECNGVASKTLVSRLTGAGGSFPVDPSETSLACTFTNTGHAASTVPRLSGPDRYGTAAEISKATFAAGVKTAYVATGENFPDALAGSAASGGDGPILLVTKDSIPPATVNELKRLKPKSIIVLGGTGVVSAEVEAALKKHTDGKVTRQAGADRFATAAAASAAHFEPGAETAFVATGLDFPDALAGGPAAAKLGGPILLTRKDVIPSATVNELRRLKPKKIVVLGGTGVVSATVEAALKAHASEGKVTRLAGADRYETAAAVSEDGYEAGVPVVYVATGLDYPDALAGGAAGAAKDGPVLLVTGPAIPTATKDELQRLKPKRIVVLGGTGVVPATVEKDLAGYLPKSS